MLKRLFLVLAFAGLLSPVYAAGTIPFSFYPQVDLQGRVMPGCKFYTIQAGTVSTPQNAYQDSALTLPLPNPQTCDASGRLPQMFLADGQIKVRLTSSTGVAVLTADNVLVVGPSGGGGGGGSVDPTTVIATGDIKLRYGTGVLTGFVRANGRTIGSATSGATERANADAQPLFEYLWTTDPNLAVSTGRGASANADWVANKTITLPDWRGKYLAGLGDMGNTATTDLTTAYYGVDPTVLGALSTPGQSRALATVNLPPYTPSGTVSGTFSGTGSSTYGQAFGFTPPGGAAIVVPTISGGGANLSPATVTIPAQSISASLTGGTPQGGTSAPFSVIPPTRVLTVYCKL